MMPRKANGKKKVQGRSWNEKKYITVLCVWLHQLVNKTGNSILFWCYIYTILLKENIYVCIFLCIEKQLDIYTTKYI